jgi:hypothetical protein
MTIVCQLKLMSLGQAAESGVVLDTDAKTFVEAAEMQRQLGTPAIGSCKVTQVKRTH